jgi:hypothetical protein
MKNMFFLLGLMLMCINTTVLAQVEKGKWFLSGNSNFGLNSGKWKTKSDSTNINTSKYLRFNLIPRIGYIVVDKLSVGLYSAFNLDNETYLTGLNEKDNNMAISGGPFARYYISNFNGFVPYVQGDIGFGIGHKKSTYYPANDIPATIYNEYKIFAYSIGGGITYFIENVGLDVFVGYKYEQNNTKIKYTGFVTNSDLVSKFIHSSNSIAVNVGVVVVLGK